MHGRSDWTNFGAADSELLALCTVMDHRVQQLLKTCYDKQTTQLHHVARDIVPEDRQHCFSHLSAHPGCHNNSAISISGRCSNWHTLLPKRGCTVDGALLHTAGCIFSAAAWLPSSYDPAADVASLMCAGR
jgi:hypothetical protein